MPGSTDSGLPYPLGSEPFADGADAIQALAEALTVPYAEGIGSTTSIPDAGIGTTVQYTTTDMSAEFGYAAGVFTYTGPTRRFLVAYEGRLETTAQPDVHEARLLHNGTIVLVDQHAETASANEYWDHFATVLTLESGDTVAVAVRQESGFSATIDAGAAPTPTFTILGQLR